MEIHEHTITINGLRTHYFYAGEHGSSVLLLHGAGTDSASLSWEHIIAPLAESGHRVFAPNLPGYGESERPDIAYTVPFYIDFVGSLMDALELERPSLVGLSMGGAISLGSTLERPQRTHKLVLAAPYGIQRKVAMHFISWLSVQTPGLMELTWALTRRSRAMLNWMTRALFHDPKRIPPALIEKVYAENQKPHAGRAFTRFQRDEVRMRSLRTVYLERLGEISAPTLILQGRQDVGVPLSCAEEAQRLIKGSRLHIIEDSGHWLQREKPEEFIRTVINFLQD